MRQKMSDSARRELLERCIPDYQSGTVDVKKEILDRVVGWTGYSRKHAIRLLNHGYPVPSGEHVGRTVKYDGEFASVLAKLWTASDCLCSKRLVPFLGDLLASLERHGHICVSDQVRTLLLSLSASTADRLLAPERSRRAPPQGTTRPGSFLRKQIAVRTHNDWDDIRPGFFEGDLVAHCGGSVRGSFLYTLVLTDVCTGWTDFEPLPSRTAHSVVTGIEAIRGRLPFPLLGLDTDNGAEFINELVQAYCGEDQIVFTRCRPYKKNDQAHVEQKNGSVVRRLVGYDRYDGSEACDALRDLYGHLRLHLNYFQPSLKLESKEREGAHVTKKYETAQTPVQRLLDGNVLNDVQKASLRSDFLALDPVGLLRRLRTAQDYFWTFAWKEPAGCPYTPAPCPRGDQMELGADAPPIGLAPTVDTDSRRNYRKTPKPKVAAANRLDCFDPIWEQIEAVLQKAPCISVFGLFRSLQEEHPGRFENRHARILRQRVHQWRRAHPEEPLRPKGALTVPGRKYRSSDIFTQLRAEIERDVEQQPNQRVQHLFRDLQRRYPDRIQDQQIHMFRKRLHQWQAATEAGAHNNTEAAR
jgi:hypothetical protein